MSKKQDISRTMIILKTSVPFFKLIHDIYYTFQTTGIKDYDVLVTD